ncbi:MAG TPA: nuclear transport factor 2 family protein [Solirubrobacterales bacterium]|jgi:ketosteroid isomerase-like protein|nr:nuclear transport factor 2 family protein [Solirubrobacterales bacterium]
MATGNTTDLAERLDAIESRLAIEDLISRYAHGFDRRSLELMMGVWHEDALFDLGGDFGSFRGRDEIAEAVAGFWRETPWMHHFMANPLIEIDGDSATGAVALDCMQRHAEDGPTMVAGFYFDRFERRDGRWGIVERRFQLSYWAPLAEWKSKLGALI